MTKRISLQELRDGGYLQEANRLFFHPLGLALAFTIDDNGKESTPFVIDARDDPEGFNFTKVDPEKAKNIEKLMRERSPQRMASLGYVVQPVNEQPTDKAEANFIELEDNYVEKCQNAINKSRQAEN